MDRLLLEKEGTLSVPFVVRSPRKRVEPVSRAPSFFLFTPPRFPVFLTVQKGTNAEMPVSSPRRARAAGLFSSPTPPSELQKFSGNAVFCSLTRTRLRISAFPSQLFCTDFV